MCDLPNPQSAAMTTMSPLVPSRRSESVLEYTSFSMRVVPTDTALAARPEVVPERSTCKPRLAVRPSSLGRCNSLPTDGRPDASASGAADSWTATTVTGSWGHTDHRYSASCTTWPVFDSSLYRIEFT